ncbi:hypothetical protein Tco_0673851 [Tanacetum coccineum]
MYYSLTKRRDKTQLRNVFQGDKTQFPEKLQITKNHPFERLSLDFLAQLDGYHDSDGDILYLESLISNDTILSLPPKVFLDHDPRSLSDINDLKIMVKDCPDFEDSRARGFVHRPLDLQSLA